MRSECDTLGKIDVPDDKYWGAQTQRSLENFKIGTETMPFEMVEAIAIVKKAAALTNYDLKNQNEEITKTIVLVCDEILGGRHWNNFPLVVWQTGSGTHSNMNMNEVIANRANELLGYNRGTKEPIHPNDHVNKSQSSNDTFPTAMHIAVALYNDRIFLPVLESFKKALDRKAHEYKGLVKIGRTHLQDATPLALGQEFSGYAQQIRACQSRIMKALEDVYYLAQGGTAVGTGVNAPKGFSERFVEHVSKLTGLPFKEASNKFEALACHDTLVAYSGSLSTLAVSLNKIANDIRWLGSGPRCGLGELNLPVNEPGSSIMPGKVNPTQAEALTMVCLQVMGNHTTVTMAGASGNFELNVYKPVIIYNVLQSLNLLADSMASFQKHCLDGLQANEKRIGDHLRNSLMLVTALVPHVGYDRAAAVAKYAHEQDITLKEAAKKILDLSAEDFDSYVEPEKMTHSF